MSRRSALTDLLGALRRHWWIDGFTEGADPEYAEQILPLAADELAGARRVLDIGCGDGQITRLAAAARRRRARPSASTRRGTRSAWPRERGGATGFVRAGADALPFADGSFDAAVACLVFEHIDDVDAAIAEIARVLEPGGRFCFFLNHPLLQTPGSGWIDDQILDPPEQYWRIGPYLAGGGDDRGGRARACTSASCTARCRGTSTRSPTTACCSTRMIEPAPPPGFLALAAEYDRRGDGARACSTSAARTVRWPST